jgi:hypothetical protein
MCNTKDKVMKTKFIVRSHLLARQKKKVLLLHWAKFPTVMHTKEEIIRLSLQITCEVFFAQPNSFLAIILNHL